jgi:hypothetical protein
MTHDELCPEVTQQALAFLRGAGYTLRRHKAGYWLIDGPACYGRVPDACLIHIARTIRGERPC